MSDNRSARVFATFAINVNGISKSSISARVVPGALVVRSKGFANFVSSFELCAHCFHLFGNLWIALRTGKCVVFVVVEVWKYCVQDAQKVNLG